MVPLGTGVRARQQTLNSAARSNLQSFQLVAPSFEASAASAAKKQPAKPLTLNASAISRSAKNTNRNLREKRHLARQPVQSAQAAALSRLLLKEDASWHSSAWQDNGSAAWAERSTVGHGPRDLRAFAAHSCGRKQHGQHNYGRRRQHVQTNSGLRQQRSLHTRVDTTVATQVTISSSVVLRAKAIACNT